MPSDYISIPDSNSESIILMEDLRARLPRSMREQLSPNTQIQAYFLLAMLSNDACVHRLHQLLQEQYKAPPSSQTPIEQALSLVSQLQESPCNHEAPFKFRLPHFLGEYPVHSRAINNKINRFNRLIEIYHQEASYQDLNPSALNEAYQNILKAIKKHYMGCNVYQLWQLLKSMSTWSTRPIDELLSAYPLLLNPVTNASPSMEVDLPALPKEPVTAINPAVRTNKQTDLNPFTSTSDYLISEAGRLADSVYLTIHGFALKPGGHADALAKRTPGFLPWADWQQLIARQLSQQIDVPLSQEFFDWMQTVLRRLGIQFIPLNTASYHCYVSPFLDTRTILNMLNEEMVMRILEEQCQQASFIIDPVYLPIISRYLIRFLQPFQYNRGQALGIGANWGGVINDSNEDAMDTFRLNDPDWSNHFKHLSLHRQGPAEARMNAAIGIRYELGALLTSFEYMTKLQPAEYADTLYSALLDNLMATLFPEPPYFENKAYTKYRLHFACTYTDDGMQEIISFPQPDPQGTHFKTAKGNIKQTPMYREAGSLRVEAFPRDTGSGECLQSLSVANPLWPLQLQYAQCSSTGTRGHVVYNPIGPDEFIPDAFYGQVIRETDEIFIPYIGVVPKNFDKEEELCASFVVRMLQSSRLMVYCPVFRACFMAIASRFLPAEDKTTPPLIHGANSEIKRKWQALDNALHHSQLSADFCHEAFFSLFKELIFSLYSLTKEDRDLHSYFMTLTTSEEAFKPQSRATCERLIRELTTLKPLQNVKGLQYYENVLTYLTQLTEFFYPLPCDETAAAIAEQARIYVEPLLALQEIKDYFADLTQKGSTANISKKISPGLMHNALAYQAPSPKIADDFYVRRHIVNLHSGYRDLDGNQIATPSSREMGLDLIIKTVGALLPLIHRDKTLLSLLTQPFAQAYIAGHQAYNTREQFRIIQAILSGTGGFIYGIGLGAIDSLSSIPKTIYNALFASVERQQKANHPLAISAAPGNEPGLRMEAMMAVRDHLLQLMARANGHEPSQGQLVDILLTHVKKIHPSLLSGRIKKEEHYRKILSESFPLAADEWKLLFSPAIETSIPALQQLVNRHALQIDNVLIYALYECLTAPKNGQTPDEIIKSVISKHKLKDPQDKALTAFVSCYDSHPEARRTELVQYRFNGAALNRLREKERSLRKIQIWLNNALDRQWALEVLLSHSLNHYKILLNQATLAEIVLELPDSMKEILHTLFSKSGNDREILKYYQLQETERTFLLQCSNCYKTISSPTIRTLILKRTLIHEVNDSSLSTKNRAHLNLTQFVEREWQHQLLPANKVASIIKEIKRQIEPLNHPSIDALLSHYKTAVANLKCTNAFDEFYEAAIKIQTWFSLKSPLQEWLNVTMNGFMNRLLDDITWVNERKLTNRLSESQALLAWLNHLITDPSAIRSLLNQQIEQTESLDHAAWRCQHILRALEGLTPGTEYIRHTGMQKLLRVIVQNNSTITSTGEQKDREVPVKALCEYSSTMQHALWRVREKIPNADVVRPLEITWKGH